MATGATAAAIQDYDQLATQITALLPAEGALAAVQGQLNQARQQVANTQQSLNTLQQKELRDEQKLNNLQNGMFKFLVPNRAGKEAVKSQEIANEKAQIAQLQGVLGQQQQQEQALRQQESTHLAAVQQLNGLRQRQQAAFLAVVNANRSPQLTQLEQKLQMDNQTLQAETVFAQQLESLLPYYRNALGHYAAAMQLEMRAEQSNMTDVMFENSFSEYNRDVKMQQAQSLAAQASAQLMQITPLIPPRLFQVNPQLGNMLRQVPVANLTANNLMTDLIVDEFGRGADLMNDIQTEQRLQRNMMIIRQCEGVLQQHIAALQQFVGQIRGYIGTLTAQIGPTNAALHQERIRIFEAARTANNMPAPAGAAPPPMIPTPTGTPAPQQAQYPGGGGAAMMGAPQPQYPQMGAPQPQYPASGAQPYAGAAVAPGTPQPQYPPQAQAQAGPYGAMPPTYNQAMYTPK